jgi:CelD/BcsL family acetyltransferase involved in cellulose biosynthesis
MIFYKNFCVSALDRGWFYGHLLEVAGEPIAYIYGIVYQGVFYDFKESYKVQYKESSPGHVLKTFVFDELCKRNIRLYDFMGACDDYKMKWTDKTYSRSTYVLYNDNLGGLALRLAEKVARYLRHRSMRSNLDRRVRTEYRG